MLKRGELREKSKGKERENVSRSRKNRKIDIGLKREKGEQ